MGLRAETIQLLQKTPHLTAEEIADMLGCPLKSIHHVMRELRAMPIGSLDRAYISGHVRISEIGVQTRKYALHPNRPDRNRPSPMSSAHYSRTYRAKNKALLSLRNNGARSRYVQGGLAGIWSGLRV